MIEKAIQIEKLSRHFQNKDRIVQAVDSLSFEVFKGCVFGFIGPNGAGKTTTIRLILGLLKPSFGYVKVFGLNPQYQPQEVRCYSGALLENNGIYEQLSAEENLEFYGRVYQLSDSVRRERIQELLVNFKLWGRRKESTKGWSLGMKQKLALARAMLHNPLLLVLDEPTSGLDVEAAVEVRNILSDLAAKEKVTIFLTTHNMAEAEKLCDRIAVIREGRLLAVGSPAELKKKVGFDQIEITGKKFDMAVIKLLRAMPEILALDRRGDCLIVKLRESSPASGILNVLVEAGVAIQSVRSSSTSFEEVFLALMKEEK